MEKIVIPDYHKSQTFRTSRTASDCKKLYYKKWIYIFLFPVLVSVNKTKGFRTALGDVLGFRFKLTERQERNYSYMNMI